MHCNWYLYIHSVEPLGTHTHTHVQYTHLDHSNRLRKEALCKESSVERRVTDNIRTTDSERARERKERANPINMRRVHSSSLVLLGTRCFSHIHTHPHTSPHLISSFLNHSLSLNAGCNYKEESSDKLVEIAANLRMFLSVSCVPSSFFLCLDSCIQVDMCLFLHLLL